MEEYIDKQAVIDELDDKYSLGDIGRMEHDIIVDAWMNSRTTVLLPLKYERISNVDKKGEKVSEDN